LAQNKTKGKEGVAMFNLQSSSFSHGGEIPKKYTIDGEGVSPPLNWDGVPEGTKSFALAMIDPDALPMATPAIYTHWVVYDIPASATGFSEGAGSGGELPPEAKQLPNSAASLGMGDIGHGYGPPWPPDKSHRYTFTLYALSEEKLPVSKDAGFMGFMRAILPVTISSATLVGLYGPAERKMSTGRQLKSLVHIIGKRLSYKV
jgi:Raf kinase inhibitor-like protein, YbhB/YbcL family